ncbi:MAG: phage tail tape measure C-terminal domain-containing protein [Heliomarina sp.]|uniref:phage tail tape measure C-terminal domain-containing protein n=1 Tax=Heliomarina sp. TaxID=2917556 RepID=UPI0040590657
MNREKSISVRFAAVGGQIVKAEMRDIGTAGREAMQGIASSTGPASAGIDVVSSAASEAQRNLEAIAARAGQAARAMRTTAAAATPMVDQINRLTGVTPAIGQTTSEYLRQGQVLDDLRAKYNPIYGVIRRYRSEVSEVRAAHLEGAISADEMAAAISRSRQAALGSIAAYKGMATSVTQVAHASRAGSMRMQQLAYQVNDIGVSLAGGMNPFLVMAQQGTQIAQVYGFGNGGVGGVFRDLGRMLGGVVSRFPLLTAGFVAAGAAILGMRADINEAQNVTVGFGDVALATFQVIGRGIKQFIQPATELISGWFQTAWDKVVESVRWLGNAIINGFSLVVEDIKFSINVIPDLFSAAWNSAKEIVFNALADMLGGIGGFLKDVAEGLNSVFGTDLSAGGALFDAAGGARTVADAAGVRKDAATGRIANSRDGYLNRQEEILNRDPLGDFYNSVRDQSVRNARNKDEDGKGGQKDKVDDLVKSLQSELAVLRETDPVKKKMLEYADKLADAADMEQKQVADLVAQLDKARTGYEAISRSLATYAEEAKRIGDDIGDALAGGFKSAENAFRDFVSGGKADFKSLVQSMLADLAVLQFRQSILGPIAGALSDGFIGKAVSSLYLHGGGDVGAGGRQRTVPAALFAGAQRFHGGGFPGLASDEVPAILQRGERVQSKAEVAAGKAGGGVLKVILGDGLKAEFLSEANEAAVQISDAAVNFYDKKLPERVATIRKNPRMRS